MVHGWEVIAIVILLALSAFFSASETALISLNKVRIRHLKESGVAGAEILSKVVSRPNRLLSTILVGNNIVNIAMTSLATAIALRIFASQGVGIATAIMTILILIFGEITPKSYAAVYNERIALGVAFPIYWLQKLFYPIVKIIGFVTNLIIILPGGEKGSGKDDVTEEEIRIMVDLGEGQGAIERQEREMIDNVFELNDTMVHEIMLPRVDIVAVTADSFLSEAWDKVIKYGHSRLPVYEESLDNIIGVIYAKDLMSKYQQLKTLTSRSVMREALYVPEAKIADELLREMRRERIHIAVVLDEFGGTAGLIFFEDLVETIVGEIGDEYDIRRTLVETVNPEQIRVSARVSVDKVNDLLGLSLPEEEFDTIGGLVFHMVGEVPRKGDRIEFDDCVLTVDAMDGKRVSKVLVTKITPE